MPHEKQELKLLRPSGDKEPRERLPHLSGSPLTFASIDLTFTSLLQRIFLVLDVVRIDAPSPVHCRFCRFQGTLSQPFPHLVKAKFDIRKKSDIRSRYRENKIGGFLPNPL